MYLTAAFPDGSARDFIVAGGESGALMRALD